MAIEFGDQRAAPPPRSSAPRALRERRARAQAIATSWQVNALVEATPISGPASVGARTSASRAMLEVGTLTTATRARALLLGVAQRGQRVGGLAGLRDEDRQAALVDRRLAVAIFAGDVDLDRQPGEALDPVFADEARHIGGAAGDDRDARRALRRRPASRTASAAARPCRRNGRSCGRSLPAARGSPWP